MTAFLAALAAHAVIGAALALWRVPAALPTAVEARFNLVGTMSEPGGGQPDAGGQSTPVPTIAPPMPVGAVLPPPPPALAQLELPVVEVGAWVLPASGTFSAGAATGFGHGKGTGMGEGAGEGLYGSGGSGPGGTGSGNGAPGYLRCPQPRYPSLARQQGWEGTTVLRVEVRDDGVAGTIEVVQSAGHEVLDAAAIEAIRKARFQAVNRLWVEVPITFRLNRS